MISSAVIPAKAGIYLNRFRVKHGMTMENNFEIEFILVFYKDTQSEQQS